MLVSIQERGSEAEEKANAVVGTRNQEPSPNPCKEIGITLFRRLNPTDEASYLQRHRDETISDIAHDGAFKKPF